LGERISGERPPCRQISSDTLLKEERLSLQKKRTERVHRLRKGPEEVTLLKDLSSPEERGVERAFQKGGGRSSRKGFPEKRVPSELAESSLEERGRGGSFISS